MKLEGNLYAYHSLYDAGSVSDDYLQYMLLQFPTNVTGWICHTIVTSSLLKACHSCSSFMIFFPRMFAFWVFDLFLWLVCAHLVLLAASLIISAQSLIVHVNEAYGQML